MGERAAAGFHQKRIDMPMITAIEFDDFVAAGEPAREPDTGHGCFGSAVHHPHFLDRRHPVADQFRHFDFKRIWYSET